MKLVIEIVSHTGDGSIAHRIISPENKVNIGRGYNNDVILGDPHVSARHIEIYHDGTQWWVRDLQSENGIIVNGKLAIAPAAAMPISSGDQLRIGHTELRVFAPEHPVPPALRMARASPLFLWLSRARNAWLSFFAAASGSALFAYLEVWSEEAAATTSAVAGAMIVFIVMWSLIWAAAGRLIKHKPHFTSHLGLFSLYVLASIASYFVTSQIAFLTNENMAAQVIAATSTAVLTILVIFGALALATRMGRKRRLAAACWFTLGLMGSAFAMEWAAARHFSPAPPYSTSLEPYFTAFAKGETLDAFMADNETLFADKALDLSKDKKS